jgi:hypothetical protein
MVSAGEQWANQLAFIVAVELSIFKSAWDRLDPFEMAIRRGAYLSVAPPPLLTGAEQRYKVALGIKPTQAQAAELEFRKRNELAVVDPLAGPVAQQNQPNQISELVGALQQLIQAGALGQQPQQNQGRQPQLPQPNPNPNPNPARPVRCGACEVQADPPHSLTKHAKDGLVVTSKCPECGHKHMRRGPARSDCKARDCQCKMVTTDRNGEPLQPLSGPTVRHHHKLTGDVPYPPYLSDGGLGQLFWRPTC